MSETMFFQHLYSVVLHLPILTMICAALFCFLLFPRYRAKGGGLNLLWWAAFVFLLGFSLPQLVQADPGVEPQGNQADAAEEGQSETTKEPEEEPEQAMFFDATTVTATGTERRTFEVATPVLVVPAQRIEELLPDNAADLLRNEPGVDVNGVGPHQMRPIIRGYRGLRVLFLQDGLRMNNARRQTDFGEVTSLVDVANVETMEVVRGPGSVLYGSDAIGGVLNLITKVPPAGPGKAVGGTIGLRYSSADEQSKVDASIYGHSGKFSYGFGGSVRDADEYEAPAGRFGQIDLDDDVLVNDTGVEDDTFHAYFGYRINDQQSIFFRAGIYSADDAGFGFVDPTLIGDESGLFRITFPFQDFERYSFGYSAAGLQSAAASTIDIRAYMQNNERDNGFFADINIGPIFGPGPNSSVVIDSLIFSDLETFGFRGEVTKTIGDKNLLTYGAEFYEDDSFNTRESQTTTILRAVFPLTFICGPAGAVPFPFECVLPAPLDTRASAPNATNTGQGIFIQNAFYPTDRFSGILGLRFARSETEAKPTPGWDITGLDFDDDDVVGALSLVYGISDKVNLVASYGTAFRAPNIIERLFNGLTPEGAGFQILNLDLVSEESENIDIGIKLLSANAYFEAIYFNSEVDDAIIIHTLSQAEIDALPPEVQEEVGQAGVNVVVQMRNAEVFKVDGVEIAGGYRFNNSFSVGGNFTSLDGEAEMGGPAADPTGETFKEKFNGYLRYDRPSRRWWVEYRVRHNGEEDMVLDPGALPSPIGEVLPDFTVHDVAGGVTLFEGGKFRHTLGFVIHNLTDELYAEFSNASFFRPQPERNFVVSYRLRSR